MTRLWGTRTAVPGGLALTLDGVENRKSPKTMTAAMNAAMNAADAVMVAAANGLPVRARLLGSVTPTGFAGAPAYVVNR